MRLQVRSLALLWLWCGLVATALIQPLAWGAALEMAKKKKDTRNFFAEQIVTQGLWNIDFQRRQFGGLGNGLGFGDENATKLGCDDHCTTIKCNTTH